MVQSDPARRLVAEALGTGLLVCTVVGSGIMAARLTDIPALMLISNTFPTAAILFVLITLFAPLSGAHFNPAVTLIFALRGDLAPKLVLPYLAAQFLGAVLGTLLAHAMFDLPLIQASLTVRTGSAQWLAEAVATFGLVLTILAALSALPAAIPALVAAYIAAAYWFTASTSFANPAVTIARAFSDTFSGIRPADVPAFILAQIAGALLAFALCRWLFPERTAA